MEDEIGFVRIDQNKMVIVMDGPPMTPLFEVRSADNEYLGEATSEQVQTAKKNNKPLEYTPFLGFRISGNEKKWILQFHENDKIHNLTEGNVSHCLEEKLPC